MRIGLGMAAAMAVWATAVSASAQSAATPDPASVREQPMKDRFIANYRAAEAADGRLPRVLVKAGSNHLIRGRNRTNAFSLGNMLHEFAIANGLRAITIVMLPIRPEWPNFEALPPELQALLPSRNLAGTTLVDFAPLATTSTAASASASKARRWRPFATSSSAWTTRCSCRRRPAPSR